MKPLILLSLIFLVGMCSSNNDTQPVKPEDDSGKRFEIVSSEFIRPMYADSAFIECGVAVLFNDNKVTVVNGDKISIEDRSQ